jgi:glycine/D-amino acid oxidase-like deaminating enzyme
VEESGDGLPLVGRLPVLEGAWIARGFGLSETTLATAAGVQVAAAATGGGDGTADLPWGPLRPPVGALALYRRWTGAGHDPMVDVPGVLKRRGLAR